MTFRSILQIGYMPAVPAGGHRMDPPYTCMEDMHPCLASSRSFTLCFAYKGSSPLPYTRLEENQLEHYTYNPISIHSTLSSKLQSPLSLAIYTPSHSTTPPLPFPAAGGCSSKPKEPQTQAKKPSKFGLQG